MDTVGTVIYINHNVNVVVVRFECTEQPYKSQPCYQELKLDLRRFEYVYEGMQVRLN
jgi:hypothetical protein